MGVPVCQHVRVCLRAGLGGVFMLPGIRGKADSDSDQYRGAVTGMSLTECSYSPLAPLSRKVESSVVHGLCKFHLPRAQLSACEAFNNRSFVENPWILYVPLRSRITWVQRRRRRAENAQTNRRTSMINVSLRLPL